MVNRIQGNRFQSRALSLVQNTYIGSLEGMGKIVETDKIAIR
uniref:Hypotheticial protein n=1 Tax=Schistosoma japonicum TaxID=6182 RepID=C7TZ57_SCHJA|nr:hypotheticial protein [Schistosoma japonicum]